jgi:hypothetical protein
MPTGAGRVLLLLLMALPSLLGACGNDAQGPFYGACEQVMAIDGTTSCWEAHAGTLKQLQDLRAALCDVPQAQLLPIGSRCARDGVLGGCRAAFGVADDPTVMTQGIKWYYPTTTTQTEADVRNECLAGDGMWLLPNGLFVPPDGDFPPLE